MTASLQRFAAAALEWAASLKACTFRLSSVALFDLNLRESIAHRDSKCKATQLPRIYSASRHQLLDCGDPRTASWSFGAQ